MLRCTLARTACTTSRIEGHYTPDGVWHCNNCGNNDEGVATTDHMLLSALDEKNGTQLPLDQYRFNPVRHGMEMMAQAQSQAMLQVNSSGYRLHGFASRNVTTGALQLFLINKYNGTSQKVRLTLPEGAVAPDSLVTLADDAAAAVPGSQRWGTLRPPQKLDCVASVCEFELPPLSFSTIFLAASRAEMHS